jgi:Gluconate 2-dehydrogenase subunit 3
MAFDRTEPPGEAILAETPEAAYSLEFGKTYVPPEEELPAVSLSERQMTTLAAWADRLIPGDDFWPAASAVEAHVYADNAASRSPLLRSMLLRAVDLIESRALERHEWRFAECSGEQRDELLRELEEGEERALFDLVLELLYEGYYRAAPVLAVVERRTGFQVMAPVEGVEIEPFDESLLDAVRKRPPFLREVG